MAIFNKGVQPTTPKPFIHMYNRTSDKGHTELRSKILYKGHTLRYIPSPIHFNLQKESNLCEGQNSWSSQCVDYAEI